MPYEHQVEILFNKLNVREFNKSIATYASRLGGMDFVSTCAPLPKNNRLF